MAIDAAGNIYVTGETLSSNLPVTAGAFQTKHAGRPGTIIGILGTSVSDAFVVKLSPSRQIVYATYLGGVGFDTAAAIAVDPSDNVYLGGRSSVDFPITPGAYRTQGGGAFAAKLNAAGAALVYSTFLGDNGSGITSGIAIDSAGNAYVGGSTSSPNFPTTPGAIRSAIGAGNSAAFLVKLNPAGGAALYSSILGGRGYSFGEGVAVDSQGNAYFAGSTDAADFPVAAGAFRESVAGNGDAFVVKLNPAGSALVYGTLLGGGGDDRASGLTIDSTGNALVSGSTFSTDFPVTADALPKRFAGSPCLVTSGSPFGNPPAVTLCGDAFAAKLDATGSTLAYSTYLMRKRRGVSGGGRRRRRRRHVRGRLDRLK